MFPKAGNTGPSPSSLVKLQSTIIFILVIFYFLLDRPSNSIFSHQVRLVQQFV